MKQMKQKNKAYQYLTTITLYQKDERITQYTVLFWKSEYRIGCLFGV